jgi:hypothetical protein
VQWDPPSRSSTLKCEVFDRRYGCQHENVCHLIVFELLTVLCTDAAISTGCDPRVPGRLEGISGKHVQLVSTNFKGAPKFVSYLLKIDLHHIHDVRWRDLEMPGDQCLED